MRELLEGIRLEADIPETSVIENGNKPGEYFICFRHIALARFIFKDNKLIVFDPDTMAWPTLLDKEELRTDIELGDPESNLNKIAEYLRAKAKEWGLLFDGDSP